MLPTNSTTFNINVCSGSGYLSLAKSEDEVREKRPLCCTLPGLGPAYAIGKFDGILGLAWPSIAVTGATPVFQNMLAQHPELKPEFAFYLPTQSGVNGELDFGGADPNHYTGDFVTIPLTNETYWEGKLDSITSNGQTLVSNARFVADSGTSTLTAPPAVLKRFAEMIQ